MTHVAAHSRGIVQRLTSERFGRHHRENGMGAAAAEAHLQGFQIRQEIRELADVPAPADVAGLLDTAEGDAVFVRRRRIVLVDGTPLQLADSYLPPDIARGRIRERDAGPGGTYARIEEGGLMLTRFNERLRIRPASDDERAALHLDHDEQVVELHRVAFAGDRAVEYFRGVMAASRHEFVHEIDAG